jgi:hypothetical protein
MVKQLFEPILERLPQDITDYERRFLDSFFALDIEETWTIGKPTAIGIRENVRHDLEECKEIRVHLFEVRLHSGGGPLFA